MKLIVHEAREDVEDTCCTAQRKAFSGRFLLYCFSNYFVIFALKTLVRIVS